MTILSSQPIVDFLEAVEKKSIASVYSRLSYDIARTVLLRIGSEEAFIAKCDEYTELGLAVQFNEFHLFGTHGCLFLEQNRPQILSFLNNIKVTADCESIIGYIMGDIKSVTDTALDMDDVAQALYAPVRTNPVELDPENAADAAYIAVAKWTTRTCILWTIHAYEDFLKQKAIVAANQEAIKSFTA